MREPICQIPVLTFAVLTRIRQIQDAAQEALLKCKIPGTTSLNSDRALEIMTTCAVEDADIRFDFYCGFVGFYDGWLREIAERSVDSIFGCFPLVEFEINSPYRISNQNGVQVPMYESPMPFFDEVLRTVTEHLESRMWKKKHQDSAKSKALPEDPKEWPPLIQYIEAGEQIKDLLQKPKKQIRESVVRQFIAQQNGTGPEDVTWQQVQTEVAGLLPYYPAINLVPASSSGDVEAPSESGGNADAATIPMEEIQPENGGETKQKKYSPFPSSICSPIAAQKMEAYMESKGLNQTQFAIRAGTTDKTIRKFR